MSLVRSVNLPLWSIALFVLGSGCASTAASGVRFEASPLLRAPEAGLARVAFIRRGDFVGSAQGAAVIDVERGKLLGKAVNGSSFGVDLPPGDYLVCAVPVSEELGLTFPASDSRSIGVEAPVTRLSVAAGRTYLLEVTVDMGPVFEAIPARAGSPRYARLSSDLATGRTTTLVDDSPTHAPFSDPAFIAGWVQRCFDSSSDDLRLRMRATDGIAGK